MKTIRQIAKCYQDITANVAELVISEKTPEMERDKPFGSNGAIHSPSRDSDYHATHDFGI
ncbi:hypothetical protein PG990_011774 [Apiospora arundinis]